jgi:branched-chain amino acid transport system ATP-binding protein
MLLDVQALKVRYGKAESLKGVSMQVEEASIVSIVGANGAGKTTLLRTISGLKESVSGSITFLGRRIERLPGEQIARLGIGHILEGRKMFAPMTVEENLLVGACLRSDSRGVAQDMERMFDRFPVLRKKRRQPAGTLSGGEQQMVAVARALMARPKLLLMDEPSLGLSPVMVSVVAQIIRDIHRDGIGVILVEQNAVMALKLSKTAYIMELGRIVLAGDSRDIARDERVRKAYLGG